MNDNLKELSKLEELVMIAIWRLKDEAYGVNIKRTVRELSDREYFYNTLYTTFDQLTRKGYISKHFGPPTATRGGKRKVYFKFTENGMTALEAAYRRQNRIWSNITIESFSKVYTDEKP
jgi:DNA-binding PadR family transcriptional regulator